MTDLHTGLLQFGFVGDKARLDLLVCVLEVMDITVMEDMRGVTGFGCLALCRMLCTLVGYCLT